MKKIKNIVLVVSLLLNVVLFIYATTQNLAAQRNLKEAQRQQEIALEAREAAEEQRKMAEQNAKRAHEL
ncbi:MAG: hypothetical protein ABJH05_16025 [Fulvivirga sp.]